VEINIAKERALQLEPNLSIKLNIIHEDENVIAIDKPAGISTHPAKPNETNTIANALLAYYPDIKEVGDEPNLGPNLRPGIVHRLDKDTSGILIVAKNNQTFNWLKKQFAQRKVVKKYLALVAGEMKEQQGVISKPIGKTQGTIKRTTTPISGVKEAVTYYKVIQYFSCHPELVSGSHEIPEQASLKQSRRVRHNENAFTLIEAEPKTGRTHQIRVHLASIGHPLVGDKLYGFKNQICPTGLKRHFLHASYLKISLPNGKIVELKSELPKDLNDVLDDLSR
jgi:23S rRNA pseudouridine1911/1915/1917 synthase